MVDRLAEELLAGVLQDVPLSHDLALGYARHCDGHTLRSLHTLALRVECHHFQADSVDTVANNIMYCMLAGQQVRSKIISFQNANFLISQPNPMMLPLIGIVSERRFQ